MKKTHSTILWTAVASLLAVAASIHAQQASVPRDTSPQVLDVQGGKIRVVTVATGLFHPWGIAFPDANTVLVTEKNGALADDPRRRSRAAAGLDIADTARAGQRFAALRDPASEVRRQPVRLRLVPEAGRRRARRWPSPAGT